MKKHKKAQVSQKVVAPFVLLFRMNHCEVRLMLKRKKLMFIGPALLGVLLFWINAEGNQVGARNF